MQEVSNRAFLWENGRVIHRNSMWVFKGVRIAERVSGLFPSVVLLQSKICIKRFTFGIHCPAQLSDLRVCWHPLHPTSSSWPHDLAWPWAAKQPQPSNEKDRERRSGQRVLGRGSHGWISPAWCSEGQETKSGPGCFLSQNSVVPEMVPLSLATGPLEGKIQL